MRNSSLLNFLQRFIHVRHVLKIQNNYNITYMCFIVYSYSRMIYFECEWSTQKIFVHSQLNILFIVRLFWIVIYLEKIYDRIVWFYDFLGIKTNGLRLKWMNIEYKIKLFWCRAYMTIFKKYIPVETCSRSSVKCLSIIYHSIHICVLIVNTIDRLHFTVIW